MGDTTREELRSTIRNGCQLMGIPYPDIFIDEMEKLIQSEITKAQKNLLDELEAQKVRHSLLDTHIPIQVIEAKRKQLGESK